MPNVLIVTNDFPPRSGGIQSFVHALATGMPAGTVTVYAPAWPGAAEFDARQPFPVIRHPGSLMLPVPSVARRAAAILREHECDTVLFGAAAPLGLLAPGLRQAGATRIVAITHGHEAGWAALPGARSLLRRIGDQVDVMTYLGEYFRARLARALSPEAADRLVRLAPGVDTGAFRPGAGGAAIRERLRLGSRPVVLCVSRMVPRKGQDTLIKAWPQVLAALTGPGQALTGPGQARDSPGQARPAPTGPDSRAARAVSGGHGDRASRGGCGGRERDEPAGRAPRCCCWSATGRTGPTWSSWPSGAEFPGQWYLPGRFPGRSSRPITTPGTCSRCRAGPGAADWMSRASGSSTWRHPRPACR